MFNLLVTGLEITVPRGSINMPLSRVFQYTRPDLEVKFSPGGVIDSLALMGLPSIFTNESSYDPENSVIARIGKIVKINRYSDSYRIDYEIDQETPPIPNATLVSLAHKLDIDVGRRSFGDFGTNHWAIKDADLFRVLYTEDIGRFKPSVFSLPAEAVDSSLVTVMMPFDQGFNSVYAALQTASSAVNMRCLRADDIWDRDVIIEDVVKLIGTARVVICDLTNKNANVFYETGIAHTLGKNVILIAQHDSDIPFDLRHIRYYPYLANEQGLSELTKDIQLRLQTLISR